MFSYEQVVAWWHQKNISNDAELAEALNGYIISFAYNSGKIENPSITYNDTREVFENDGVCAYTGDLRTLYELRNAKYASDYFLAAFGDNRRLDEKLIKGFQKRLTLNTYDTRRWQQGERPGTYKKGEYVTGRNEVGAAADEVAIEMQELLEDLQNVDNEQALIGAAFFHAKFENIHPFADGNGRTGRLATNYFLVTHNHPPVIIHQEDRKEYFNALEAWDTLQKLQPLVDFMKAQLVKTWKKQLEKTASPRNSSRNKISFKDVLSDADFV